VFPPNAVDLRSARNRASNGVPWGERRATAFFRGNSTGPGTTPETNQRLRLAALSQAWRTQPAFADGNAVDGVRFLDAGIVNYNMRDRKMQGAPMTFIKPDALRVDKVERVPMYAQMRYKYHLYVEGHCAAMRYASMLPLGAVILKVASVSKADSMWFFPLLRPYDHRADAPDPLGDHVPVAADLSDLADVLTWCKTHDDACRAIVANASALYERVVSLEGQLDYLQLLTHEVASRFVSRRRRRDGDEGDGGDGDHEQHRHHAGGLAAGGGAPPAASSVAGSSGGGGSGGGGGGGGGLVGGGGCHSVEFGQSISLQGSPMDLKFFSEIHY
jgi:hypothetical protein